MFDIRKTGLTVMALGLLSTPAMAQLGLNTSTDTAAGIQVGAETLTNAQDTLTGAVDVIAQFDAYDTNKDGVISENEFASSIESDMSIETFSELDANSNGSLDAQEFEAFAQLGTEQNLEVDGSTEN